MRNLFYLLIMLSVASIASAQADFSKGSGIIFQPVPNGFITQLPRAPQQVAGDYYLSKEWRNGKLFLTDNLSIENMPIRYESRLNQFEIKDGDVVKVLHGSLVLYFSWINGENGAEENYVKLHHFKVNGSKLTGFARMITEGEDFNLLCVTRFNESIPTYNVAMDVGTRNTVIKKEPTYYLGKKSELVPLQGGRKKVIKAVSDFAEKDISAFVKNQKLNFRSESDYAALIQELNKKS